ncbi:hypothetical protein TOPH_04381 [Tolypocladium ophioglossoides CBS 100239]|uniref:Uncharacterized protein n=1 Tax=Tolypocladium ophioglossoides (strain CBS 100239) TaxID=1163406 RepID=A0A0L0N9V5_TOLOC|nr:hypothetical protein TOPH_04381 [Tolypocladium ophioglossoides CBS 100239]
MSSLDSELESFRRQWLADLRTRPAAAPPARSAAPPRARAASRPGDEDDPPWALDAAEPLRDGARELVSALDHYEEAMEMEAQGNMGDSLKLYRQAYRLDNRVDRRYREKHFPPGAAQKPPATPAPQPMRRALRGRWRLSPSLRPPGRDARPPPDADECEGDLFVETEGVGDKYTYRMDLALRSAGRAARNTKVVWRGFYSYNKLADDWAAFELKNHKPFYFSRVRSYGMGE